MYKLKTNHAGIFEIHSEVQGAFQGTLEPIKSKAVKMGIVPEEFDLAVSELDKNLHDIAGFGVLGKLIYTKEDDNFKITA